MPWSIPIFAGMSIKRPGPDHMGFHVEDIDAFKAHVAEVAGANPYLAPVPLGAARNPTCAVISSSERDGQISDDRSRRKLARHHRRIMPDAKIIEIHEVHTYCVMAPLDGAKSSRRACFETHSCLILRSARSARLEGRQLCSSA